jgi:uncharacterized Ntn-hydrolase superfamily protein
MIGRMTYSIVARDADTGALGVAVQSATFQVSPPVPWAEAGVGAVATQASANVGLGPLGLDHMRGGASAEEALAEALATDAGADRRQVAMIDATGRTAAHTGSHCIPAAGHMSEAGVSVQANLVWRNSVWLAMLEAYHAAEGDLAARLLAALDAAEAEGGDLRGRQSAAILVVGGERTDRPWEHVLMDLRVDDHDDPLTELRRLVGLHRAWAAFRRSDELERAGQPEAALEAERLATEAEPDAVELAFWHGLSLVREGRAVDAGPYLRRAVARDHGFAELLPRLAEAGIVEQPLADEALRALDAPGRS